MTYSMTGFANETEKLPNGDLTWELRTVNHRYLEAQFKLPEGFRQLEQPLRELVQKHIKRGKLDAVLQFQPSKQASADLQINSELANQVIQRAEQLATQIGKPDQINPMEILRWPGVVEEQRADLDTLTTPARQLLEKALVSLQAAREREGSRIKTMIDERLDQISKHVANVRERLPEVTDNVRKKISERAQTLDSRVDPERLEQELVFLAQKLDVAEELDRLDAHIAETRATLAANKPIGRRLDFLMQEFNREANTLASKSGDATTSAIAVDLKVLIEQMREQIQNVE